MLKNYLRTALRFLKKNKLFAAINIFGLSLALAVSFIMLLYVINELSYDSCHKNRKQVFRIVTYKEDFKMTMAGTPYIMASALNDEFPQIEKAINVRSLRGLRLKQGDNYIPIRRGIATSSDVFDIFTLPLLTGNSHENLLTDLNSIVISKDLAERFFPGADPLGNEIGAIINGEEQTLIVTGVFEDIPWNSTFRADCFLNSRWTLDPINKSFGITNADVSWYHDFWFTWIMLAKDADPDILEQQFRGFEEKSFDEELKHQFQLQNLSNYYLGSEDIMNTWVTGNKKNISLFLTIAFLVVLIAAMNYIILATAVSTGRAKEIGLRKTAGASKRSIREQLLSESVTLALLVLPLALILMRLGLPRAGKLFQTDLQILNSNILLYIIVYLVLTILIGVASGLYTSSYLSRLKVLDILENKMNVGKGKQVFRSILIVVQLLIFCSFVSGTLLIRSQYNYALEMDPGHKTENIILLNLGRDFSGYTPMINSIKADANVLGAAGAMHNLPMMGSMSMMIPNFQDEEVMIKIEGMSVDYNFLETMGLTKSSGRYFSKDFGEDLEWSVMLNQTAVEQLGIDDAIGKEVGGRTIIGIVEDFNLHSIHTEIPPMMISMTDKYIQQVAVEYVPGARAAVLEMLKLEWKEFAPERPFSYNLIEELIEMNYSSEKNLGTIISISALFTLLIAAFGLFGLTLFMAKSRTKEIGIKKVFGSSERAIINSFLKRNFILVSISAAFSIPLTIYFINKWLNNFAFRTEIKWYVFALAFFIAAVVVLLTVFFHSYKASRINPVEALRNQ